jgi:hypothetical protein
MTIAGQTWTLTQAAGVAPNCSTISLNPTSANAPAGGGSGSFAVNGTPSGCRWTAGGNPGWLHPSVTSGTGNGNVGWSADANTTSGQRNGSITIGGQSFTVTQPACQYTLNPTSATVPVPLVGGSGTVTVTTSAGCSWTAAPNPSWLHIMGSNNGSGSGTFRWTADIKANGGPRTGRIDVRDKVFTVTD